jgi:hypothetical protein
LGPVIGSDGEAFDADFGDWRDPTLKGFGEKMDRGSLGRTRQERWTDKYKSGQIHLKKTNPFQYQTNFKKKMDFNPSEVESLGHLQRGDPSRVRVSGSRRTKSRHNAAMHPKNG